MEAKAIKDAAARFGPSYKPKLTFVICAKRVCVPPTIAWMAAHNQHSMRFFAANPGDADRTGNLPAGTVVDAKVSSSAQSTRSFC